MTVKITGSAPVLAAYSAASLDDLTTVPVSTETQSPKGRGLTMLQLRSFAQTLLNKTLGAGSAVGAAATLLPVFASALRVGSGNKDANFIQHGSVTWDPASLASVTAVTQAVVITGAVTTDLVFAQARGNHDGLILTARVTAADTVTLRLYNYTAGAIDLASTVFDVVVMRFA